MLIQFNFKNYKSFRNDATLDLSATKITEYSDKVISICNEKILPVAAIYGANASGKSNVYDAIEFMSYYVQESFKFGGESDNKKEIPYIKPTPFLFDYSTKEAESSFEMYFIDPLDKSCKTYNYGFCVNQEEVTEEWLNSKSKSARNYTSIFYRSKKDNQLDLSGLPKKSQENIAVSLEKEVLVVSLGAKLKIPKLKSIRDWFLSNSFTDFGNPAENFFLSRLLPEDFIENEIVQSKIINYFESFDNNIRGFKIEKNPGSSEKENETYKIDSLHKMIGSEDMVTIPLSSESAGTLKMFSLYPHLQDVLEKGSVLFVDELNARLHPLLVRNFLLIFLNSDINKKNAQLIFTTHDTWQLSNNLLRRDEIWFTEKNADGVSNLYSLADFLDEDGIKIRKDESYEKNYLLGKYGAIPSLKSIDVFMEDNNGEK